MGPMASPGWETAPAEPVVEPVTAESAKIEDGEPQLVLPVVRGL
jgi:hypothetical protein